VISESAFNLVAEVQGEILAGTVPLKRGQRFRSGQVLFRINDQEARLSLAAQKSNFQSAIAGILPDLRVDHAEAFSAWESYFNDFDPEKTLADLPEVGDQKLKVFLSTQGIFNQYYQIKSTEERLSKYVVRAPFSGSFIEVNQEVNSVINPGGQVARIARSNRLELEVPVRTADLAYVKAGLAVDVYSEQEDKRWPGRIARVGSVVDAQTQSVNVYINFNPLNQVVYEGQYLRTEMPGKRKLEVMEIPRNVVVNQNEVYVVQDSMLHIKPVRIEKLNKETIYISGLDQGEFVVMEPLLSAYENMPVKPLTQEGS
ncbi:MAG: HlyD family efflux transporter periplasmic adaptor subunit, partial [Bacteroidota bacterium]